MQDRSRDVSWRTGLNANDNQCSIAEVRGTKSAVVKLWPEPAKERLAAWPVSPTTRNSSSRLDYRCACRNGVAPQIILKECRSWTFDACSKPIISFLPPRKYFGVFGSQLALNFSKSLLSFMNQSIIIQLVIGQFVFLFIIDAVIQKPRDHYSSFFLDFLQCKVL